MLYHQQDGIKLYLGDIRQILPTLGPVDLIATDPPYPVISGGVNSTDMGVLAKNDGKIFKHNSITPAEYATLFYNALSEQAQCYTMTNNITIEALLTAFRLAGFGFHNLLAWDKQTVTPGKHYMKGFEPIIFHRKGSAFTITNPGDSTILSYPNPRNKIHPTQKPVKLFVRMIENSTQPGQVVLDPFCGAGSTLLAAQITKRQAIGIEIDEEWAEVAASRLQGRVVRRDVSRFQIGFEVGV